MFGGKKKKESDGSVKSVMMAYLVLLLHVSLIGLLGLLVLFFRGVVQYMLWIFLGGSALLAASAWTFYRRMRREGKNLKEILRSPLLGGRSVEVSLLGGLASMKIGRPTNAPMLDTEVVPPRRQLEESGAQRVRDLTELARLLENKMITLEEYEIAKQQLLRPPSVGPH
jgi:hypothetical protein